MIDPVHLRTCAPQQEKPLQWEAQVLQLEKTHTQQQRPSTVKKKKKWQVKYEWLTRAAKLIYLGAV